MFIPSGQSFPGTSTEGQSLAPGQRPIFFATAGESGVVKIWSSATAQCVYEHKGAATTAGGNYTDVAMLPGNAGLMVATADCNLLFLQPKVQSALSIHVASMHDQYHAQLVMPFTYACPISSARYRHLLFDCLTSFLIPASSSRHNIPRCQ